ncbi:MAG TPA: response regulator [Candidatus Binataceae bacterium]|nr:response regulator [Candidatus Binataceae bacterium]
MFPRVTLLTEPKPILIVEDEPDAREALREFLQTHGFNVICAENGQDALDKIGLRQITPSLILLDLVMPVMDGNNFVKQAHQDERIKDVPIIVTTAHPPQQSPDMPATLVKPIRPERLLELLGRLLPTN